MLFADTRSVLVYLLRGLLYKTGFTHNFRGKRSYDVNMPGIWQLRTLKENKIIVLVRKAI